MNSTLFKIVFIGSIWALMYLIGWLTHSLPLTEAKDRKLPSRLPDHIERRLK